MTPSELANNLSAYACWSASMWSGSSVELEVRDWAIMGLGLGGEAGEVLEVLEHAQVSGSLDEVAARKEMGDVFYYWCRIVHAFGMTPEDVLGVSAPRSGLATDAIFLLLQEGVAPTPDVAAAALSARAGVVLEIFKKLIRDGQMEKERLFQAMRAAGLAWFRLAWSLGLTPSRVLEGNIAKLSSRRARGTLHGSGNNR